MIKLDILNLKIDNRIDKTNKEKDSINLKNNKSFNKILNDSISSIDLKNIKDEKEDNNSIEITSKILIKDKKSIDLLDINITKSVSTFDVLKLKSQSYNKPNNNFLNKKILENQSKKLDEIELKINEVFKDSKLSKINTINSIKVNTSFIVFKDKIKSENNSLYIKPEVLKEVKILNNKLINLNKEIISFKEKIENDFSLKKK